MWSPSSWKDFPIEQNPHYPDKCALEYFQTNIYNPPPLVFVSKKVWAKYLFRYIS
nr:3-deoxy-7-phosphoheptulonate synthase [Providencia rettgeri]ELR5075955.1 3-deoxy-7-phosphoheptulonate synthase [Providencia stuartii]ELR5224027.1 3-deoxy-7-phosphoheptulonate synthase [Providencia rettgeri]